MIVQVVSWYQFTTNCGYKDVAKLCLNFIKWNFDVVSESIDWPNLELDSLIQVKSFLPDSYQLSQRKIKRRSFDNIFGPGSFEQ